MEELVLFGLFGGFAVAAGAFAALWISARHRARRLDGLLSRLATPEDRFDLLDQRLEDIAARLEQLARGQEFLGKLAAKRLGQAAAAGERPSPVPR
jgi:hypothetical protein